MLIELKWTDRNNAKNHSTEIYRSLSPFNYIAEAQLIATVEPGINTYADKDVVQGNTYYYRFRNIKGNVKSQLSKLFEFEAIPATGPGPRKLTFGDQRFGFYGMMPVDPNAIPTLNDIRSVCNLPPLERPLNYTPVFKFAIGGTVRCIHAAPLCLGSEAGLENEAINTMLGGGYLSLTIGLHTWAIIIPSANRSSNSSQTIDHFPGELRSMLGVVTELYSRVEDVETGNRTGQCLSRSTGQMPFYQPLEDRWPDIDVKWITSSDLVDTTRTVIGWTPLQVSPPLRPAELDLDFINMDINDNWGKTLVWPVLIYTGLLGPTWG